MSLPRLPNNSSRCKGVELRWFRLDAIITFILHTLFLGVIPLLSYFDFLSKMPLHKCDRIQRDLDFILPAYGGIICTGALYVLLMELYSRKWPHLLVKDISEQI